MKYQFLIEIADAPPNADLGLTGVPVSNPRQAWQRVHELGKQGRLAEHCVSVQKVTEEPWRQAISPRRKK